MKEEKKDGASKFTIKAKYLKEPNEPHQLEVNIQMDGNQKDLLLAITELMAELLQDIDLTLDDVVKPNKTKMQFWLN